MALKIKEFLIAKTLRLFGMPAEVADYVNSFLAIGYHSGEPIPKVLMDFNLINIVRGIYTRFVVSTNLDWIWPFWMERQFYAKYNDFSARGFQPASINTSHRNWTGIGTLVSENESVVDPRGLLTPYNNSWSLDCWVQFKGKVYSPASLAEVKQYLVNNLPIVRTEYVIDNKLLVTITAFVGSIDLGDIVFQKVEIKNISKEVLDDNYFAFAVRPYNTEGIALIKSIQYKETGEIFVNKKLAAVMMTTPYGVLTSHLSKGDCKLYFDEAKNNEIQMTGKSRVGMATGISIYKMFLRPGDSLSYEIRMPNDEVKVKHYFDNEHTARFVTAMRKYKYETVLQTELDKWQKAMKQGLSLELPDKNLENAFSANKAFLLMFYDGETITPGPSTYHAFWFRDATYLINGLDKLGFHKEAERILLTYPHRQRQSGFFLSQRGEWDSNGQAIWTLMEHYRLTRNKSFLQKVYKSIERGARWIAYKRKTNLYTAAGYRGLMPPGLSAEHFGLDDYYYWDDFWSLAGLRDAAHAAQAVCKEPKNFLRSYKQLETSMEESFRYVESRLAKPIMPISPSRRMDSAAVGCLSAYYPCRLYESDNIRLINTVDYLHDKCFINGGFFHDVNHSGYNPYLTMHIAQCHIGQRSQQAADILNWLMSVVMPTFTWPEAIHPRTLGGTIGDGHHGWAAADFILLIRNMLFMEEGHRLVITPVMPLSWLKKKDKIVVKQAPTYFGELNYTIEINSPRELVLNLRGKFENKPKFIEWSLPKKIKKATIDGKPALPDGTKIIFSPTAKKIQIVLA